MRKMPESARIGESARYFVTNQPMRYGIEIVYSLEVEHCIWSSLRVLGDLWKVLVA